ncbi:hypothetical protein J5I95_22770 [Candidatus Poribacteria bacterium]|nr:hypothetical protein [Candidatus Poribacteria bacterium]
MTKKLKPTNNGRIDFLQWGKSVLLCAILCIAFGVRLLSVDAIPNEHFTGIDPYLYYWQASLISEHGQLPGRDMHRWLPVGRDLGQTLNLYGYVLAYAHKTIAFVFTNITLYQICLYTPVVCFCIGLGAFCLYLYHTHGWLFSSIVGILLATLPGSIERSTAGFGDRDAFCLMLGILAVTTYLVSLQATHRHKRLLWTLASGSIVFLGGISWEGFGVFLSVIIVVEIYRFLSSETEDGLGLYALWGCCFVPTLYLATPAYRNGYGFAEHLFAFVLVPPVVLLGIRALRHLLLAKVEKLRPYARHLALGLTLVTVALAIGYIWIQRNTFAETTVPLSQNTLMQNVGELKDTNSQYWMILFGYIFVLGIIGVMISALHQWKNHGALLVIPLTFFTLTSFFREYLDQLWGAQNNNLLFFIAIAATAMALLLTAWRREQQPKNELAYVAAITWFLIWTSLTRDAERYAIFTAPFIAFFTAELIQFCSLKLCNVKRIGKLSGWIPQPVLKTSTAFTLLALLVWLPSPYGYAWNTLRATTHLRRSVPPYQTITQTFRWMKAELPNTTVVATDWIHGSPLNVLGGVKTITDQDTFIQHWIHLYYRYIFCGQSEKEVLQFLKSHEATHLMLTEVDITKMAHSYSKIGRHSEQTPTFEIVEFRDITREKEHLFLFPTKVTPFFKNIQMNISPETDIPPRAIALSQNGTHTNIPYVVFSGKERNVSNTQDGSKTGGIILYFDESYQFQKGYYVPPIAWDNFTIRLFLRGIPSNALKPVYEVQETGQTDVKVWEIHYPPDIQPHPKYLKTGIPEIDARLPLQ